MSGLVLNENTFRDVSEVDNNGGNLTRFYENNTVAADPVATGFSTSNVGVGNIPAGPDWKVVVEDDNPNSLTYGEMLNAPLLSSSNEPSTGTYGLDKSCGIQAPRVRAACSGQRLTTGSGNVSGTDWMPLTSFDGSPTSTARRGAFRLMAFPSCTRRRRAPVFHSVILPAPRLQPQEPTISQLDFQRSRPIRRVVAI